MNEIRDPLEYKAALAVLTLLGAALIPPQDVTILVALVLSAVILAWPVRK